VIAIIAILAAILFPVFAQAKESAKRVACLSNARQQGIALQLYLGDSDDRIPSPYNLHATGEYFDVWNLVMPYAKSQELFYSPDRTESGCTLGTNGAFQTNVRCIGYGFNWGPFQDFTVGIYEGGLLSQYDVEADWEGAVGISGSQIVATANTFAFSDTRDYTWYTNATNEMLSKFSGTTNHDLPHGGMINMNYVDGHAKAIQFKLGFVKHGIIGPGIRTPNAFPKNANDNGKWCSDESTLVAIPSGPTLIGPPKPPTTVPCGQAVATVESTITLWASD
jgi:prepilin-type processing-associated H-X9-DG protein